MVEALETASILPTKLLILPHRSLTAAGLGLFLALQGVAMGGFAALAAWHGNVFAPFFALLDWCAVAYALMRVWRRSVGGEVVALGTSILEVTRLDGCAPPQRFHPYWVRVELLPGRHAGWARRLVLRSHGREVEIGTFLNESERAALARQLIDLLAQAGHEDALRKPLA